MALLAITALRLLIAAVVPLAPDEAYYWVWSRALAPGYLDHPPMVALWIRLGTELAGPGALGVRLLGPLSALLGSLLLADAAECLLPGRNAGVTAAALLNATLLFGVGTVIMTPDTPLLFFWTACLWAIARRVDGGSRAWWLAAGAFAGAALASKYTALLLVAGIGLWALVVPRSRRDLLRFEPWAGVLLALLVFLPVLLWNADHHWASFLRQGGRVEDWAPSRAAHYLGELVGGQALLATPLAFVLCVAGGAAAVRQAWRGREPGWTLLALLILPGALVFVQHAFGDRVQGNWPAILYPAAAIAGAGLDRAPWRRLRRPAVLLGLAFTAVVYAQATVGLLHLPPRIDPVARELRGWRELATEVSAAARAHGAGYVVSQQYTVASELARELPRGLPMVGAETRWGLTKLPAARMRQQPGLLLWPARDKAPDPTLWPDARPVGVVSRNNAPGEAERLYLVNGLPPGIPAVRLPRP